MFLPSGADAQQPSDDTQVDAIHAGGLTLQVERGMPYLVAPREEVPLASGPLHFTAATADKPAELAATWNLDSAGRDITRLSLNYRNGRELDLACRIAASTRPLGRGADLSPLRVVAAGQQRCVLLGDGGLQRRDCGAVAAGAVCALSSAACKNPVNGMGQTSLSAQAPAAAARTANNQAAADCSQGSPGAGNIHAGSRPPLASALLPTAADPVAADAVSTKKSPGSRRGFLFRH